jgi:hypothetical protein
MPKINLGWSRDAGFVGKVRFYVGWNRQRTPRLSP